MTWKEFQDRFMVWASGIMMATLIGLVSSMNSKLDQALIRQAVGDQKQEYLTKEFEIIKTTVEQHKMDIRDLQNALKPEEIGIKSEKKWQLR